MASVLALIEELASHNNRPNETETALLERAYALAEHQHSEQKRSSGEPYFNHVFAAAMNCARYGLDYRLVIAGLLHDTLEDTGLDPKIIESEFGADILAIVEGVTKLGKLKYRGNERHVESLRKFFVSMAADMRVVIVKCADRLHNLETLEHVRPDKRKRIAIESIEIYSQLASRLGMGKLAGAIQDAAFPFAYPEDYQKTQEILDKQKADFQETMDRVYRSLVKKLGSENLRPEKLQQRVKGTYSLYKKIVRKNWSLEEVHDIIALRVITKNVDECYRALGLIHAHFKPVPGRIKDYIALPKPNGYQSLHTSVFAGDGNIVEIQIRTTEMHQFAEYGIASHHLYKRANYGDAPRESFSWLAELAKVETVHQKPSEFLATLRSDFFNDRIFVYTPNGDVIDLPAGASVIDFAFAVHSDIGLHASGARVDGKYVALKTKLEQGQVVEVITDKKAKPSAKWLEDCKTTMAKRFIRGHVQKHGGVLEKLGLK
jgi:GTP diphosphokinase / guanosine-3',5'-bis(diphosphate) 3'-diphosphatase